jgi:AcrR family transcriptional regulator
LKLPFQIWYHCAVARTADVAHRAKLLEDITDYMIGHGYAGLSLRPLAKAVRSSPRVLLYYFKSKENLAALALGVARERQRAQFERLRERDCETCAGLCRAIWSIMRTPDARPHFRLFFEVYGLALQDRRRYAAFLRSAVFDWLRFIEEPYIRAGSPRSEARAMATAIIAGFRGFMLDLCGSGDLKRIDRAVKLWIHALEAPPFQPKNT